jgi:hypothetical protein
MFEEQKEASVVVANTSKKRTKWGEVAVAGIAKVRVLILS